jgi:prolyl-tRNA synthetase
VRSYGEFKEILEAHGGFLKAFWDGASEDEDRIKEETKATIRCFPFDDQDASGECFFTGRKTQQVAVFARAY